MPPDRVYYNPLEKKHYRLSLIHICLGNGGHISGKVGVVHLVYAHDFQGGDQMCIRDRGRVELTKNEFRILQLLLENRGKIVSREELMMHLWQSDLYVEENTLTVNVARLRKKLEEGGLEGVILTKPGRGYIIL